MAKLSKDELAPLLVKAKAGDIKARNAIIMSVWPLVVARVNRFVKRGIHLAPMREDLEQSCIAGAGNQGIVRAIEKFDPESGFTFTTYVVPWIDAAISRAAMQLNPVSFASVKVQGEYQRIRNVHTALSAVQSDEPSFEQMRGALSRRTSAEQIDKALAKRDQIVDVQADVSDSSTVEERLIAIESLGELACNMSCLTSQEAAVISKRFGLESGSEASIHDIAASLGITKGEVMTLKNTAIGKLRRAYGKSSDAPLD